MKEIRAIVRPQRLAQLREVLRAIPNFPGLTLTQAEGFTAPAGVQKRTVKEELTDYTPKILVTVIAEESMIEVIRQAIMQVCSTGQIGDGLVWTVPIESIHRIRNGESLIG
jgi:nitrogen regulatory protein P-II 1